MATLEMVPLRSTMPFTGRVTLRYALPTVKIDVPADLTIDKGAAPLPRITTTPQVEEPQDEAALETPARKGGEAR
jgi:hypothetical protein